MSRKIAFIGAGNMGSALVRGLSLGGSADDLLVYSRRMEPVKKLAGETGCIPCDSPETALSLADYIFLCVKPYGIKDVISELAPILKKGSKAKKEQVIVSIAAGVTIEKIAGYLSGAGVKMPVMRIMPNTPVSVGAGVILMSADKSVPGEMCTWLAQRMSSCAMAEFVTEGELEQATAVFGCGPAYVYMFIDALADGAVQVGVPRDKALSYAAQTLTGAAKMVQETGEHPGRLKDKVCSPGGSTIVGVAALEKGNFRSTVSQAVVESARRNKELG